MRRNVILVAVLATGLLGCSSFRDLFSAHADVAAEAGSQQLPAQRLAQILSSGGKGVKKKRAISTQSDQLNSKSVPRRRGVARG